MWRAFGTLRSAREYMQIADLLDNQHFSLEELIGLRGLLCCAEEAKIKRGNYA